MIRTIIVDDEVLSRIGMQSLIQGKEDICVTGLFGSAQEALEFLRSNPVDVVLTDIEMAGIDGLDFISIIREENLADGVIIVSCHNDFTYAREAITRGTDAYLLKVSIDEEQLVREILRVYEKKSHSRSTGLAFSSGRLPKPGGAPEVYRLAVLLFRGVTSAIGKDAGQVENRMLAGLLEEIVRRYQMGTLFSPRGRDMFLIFTWDAQVPESQRAQELQRYLQLIRKNIAQYTEKSLYLGLSEEFTGLQEVQSRYEEALSFVGGTEAGVGEELEGALRYMETHLAEPISLQELARISGMSVPTFCKKFKDVTGLTMTRYLNEQRIEKVKGLLCGTATLPEIAEQTGFSNDNYLSRVFKSVTGITISEYRERMSK